MTDQSDFADHVLSLGINNIGDSYALAFTATYICGGKTFQILVAGDPPPGYDTQSTEVEWTEQLLDLSMHDGTDVAQFMAQDIFLQKLAQDIMRIALPKMLELAPPAPGLPPPRDPRRGVHTVYEHLCPDMVKLQLVSRDGCFELIEGHNTQLPADDLKPITHSELEKFGVKDTELLPTHAASEVVLLSQCKAGMSAYYATNLKRTEEWVCKLAYRWCQEATLRELETLAKIQTSRLRPGLELRVSTLKGTSIRGHRSVTIRHQSKTLIKVSVIKLWLHTKTRSLACLSTKFQLNIPA